MFALQVVAAVGVLTVPELGRWRLTRELRVCVDDVVRTVVEQGAWHVEPRARCWGDVRRLYAHWYCRCCGKLVPAGLWGQWRGSEYVTWCRSCHMASTFLPALHPPELPWGAALHYAQVEPLHFLMRVLRAHQGDERKPPTHHNRTNDEHVHVLGVHVSTDADFPGGRTNDK
jgi:hypothetical protein